MERERGREAERPQDIPKPGWRDIFWRTKAELSGDHVSMVAASIAFYGLLAMFPAVAAIISIWGLMFDPQQIAEQIATVSGVLPEDAAIINNQAQSVAAGAGAGVSLAAAGGILLTLYSASKGMTALIEWLNKSTTRRRSAVLSCPRGAAGRNWYSAWPLSATCIEPGGHNNGEEDRAGSSVE
jgi:membrane protein